MINFPIYNKLGKVICHTKIDKQDLPKISNYTWRLQGRGYIKAKINKKDVYLHRFVMNATNPKDIIDHINNDPLDNTKRNLRFTDILHNSYNRQKKAKSSSKYKGVSFNKKENKWVAYIKTNGIKYNLGFYMKEKDAAREYNKHAKLLFGKFCRLNKFN